jgi:hypothetical protein
LHYLSHLCMPSFHWAIFPLSHCSIEPWSYRSIKPSSHCVTTKEGMMDHVRSMCEKGIESIIITTHLLLLLVVIPPFTYSIYPQWYSLVAYSVVNGWGHVAKWRRKE